MHVRCFFERVLACLEFLFLSFFFFLSFSVSLKETCVYVYINICVVRLGSGPILPPLKVRFWTNLKVRFWTKMIFAKFYTGFRPFVVQKFVFCVLGFATCCLPFLLKWPFLSNGEKCVRKNLF